jgi:hypothetical protein
MLNWLKSFFRVPEPAGPPQPIRQFSLSDKPITQDGVSADQGGWRIASQGQGTIRLFEVAQPGIEQCLLTYRAQMKTENLQRLLPQAGPKSRPRQAECGPGRKRRSLAPQRRASANAA